MARQRSASLEKLATLFFEGNSDPFSSEALNAPRCTFQRTVSEDSTVPGLPFSRFTSPAESICGESHHSDEEHHELLRAAPEAASLLKGPLTDPGPEVLHSQEMIAVKPGGEARFLSEEELDAAEVLSNLLDEPSSIILVARDGTAYYMPDGDHIQWDQLQEEHATRLVPEAVSRASSIPRGLKCARSLSPTDQKADQNEDEEVLTQTQKLPGSIPRTPSLKHLSALLFTTSGVGAEA